jgi:hypothetical protein
VSGSWPLEPPKPNRVVGANWRLMFPLDRTGFGLRAALRHLALDVPRGPQRARSLVYKCWKMLKLFKFVQCPARVSGTWLRSASRFGMSRSDREAAFSAIKEPYWTTTPLSKKQLSPVFTMLPAVVLETTPTNPKRKRGNRLTPSLKSHGSGSLRWSTGRFAGRSDVGGRTDRKIVATGVIPPGPRCGNWNYLMANDDVIDTINGCWCAGVGRSRTETET